MTSDQLRAAEDVVAVAISARVDELRHARRLSLRRLASRALLAQHTVLKVTKATTDARMSTLVALAEALGCELKVEFASKN